MLRKFRVKNFLSFRDWQTLDLTVAANAPEMPGRFVRSVPGSRDRFPTFVAIFGANASGKTNLLRAITFLTGFVQSSHLYQPNAPLPSIPSFFRGTEEDTSEFEIEIDGRIGNSDHFSKLNYGLEISADQKRVLKETLSYSPSSRPRRLFFRDGQEFKFGDNYQISRSDPSIAKIRENCSVISILAQFNHPLSTDILKAFSLLESNVAGIIGTEDIPTEIVSKYYKDNPSILNEFLIFSRKIDINLEDVKIFETGGEVKPIFFHRGTVGGISESNESHGTNKIFAIFPSMHYALKNGGIAVFDELDNAIHSLILPEIVDMFTNPGQNPNRSQLIAVCQNPSILQYLEKEEIFFAEKCNDGATEIYGLKDIKGVRRESNIYANYLAGAFGGVPKVA